MDLFKDPILSSVISMVTPTWCHGATWGNPFLGDCGRTWHRNWHFYISNSFKWNRRPYRWSAFWVVPPFLLSFANPWNDHLSAGCRSEQSETLFLPLQLQLLKYSMTWMPGHECQDMNARQEHDLQVWYFFLFDGFWWGWTFRAFNSLELEQLFMPLRHGLTTVPKGSKARHLL